MTSNAGGSTAEPARAPPSSEHSNDLLVKYSLEQQPELSERPTKIARAERDHIADYEDEEDSENGDNLLVKQIMSSNRRTQRYLVAIEYIGTRFSGSQKQPNCRTVVGVLEAAFQKFIGQPVSIFCSSRTDAGVHALSNVCHVDVERISKRKPGEALPPHEPSVVRRAVNHFLQKDEGDVMVIDARFIPSDFHARYKAQERVYYYRLLSGTEPLSSFEKDRAWHVPQDLNLHAMQEACKVLVGRHDFSSFRAAGCQANSPIRTLDELRVCEAFSTPYFPSAESSLKKFIGEDLSTHSDNLEVRMATSSNYDGQETVNHGSLCEFGRRREHSCFIVTARARSFLYHQVRLLVGVLKSVGTGDLTTCDVEEILNAKSVTAASPMAPACGLFLGRVKYESVL
ncbi:hypothetical protein Nepgr_008604 [Nepenthes gracilis]|uniref:tRNA pseudouridine synthase n=1 Tax=Nepenthes gracilis TaxID=150966 RepID=A0AAD3XJF5_NEPGR|nr:hypothetical protein Nepgr_008604 [Nepenthes gracilis]